MKNLLKSRELWYNADIMHGPQYGPFSVPSFDPLAVRTHEEMKPVLMHPDSDGPGVHYYMIRGGSEQKNITVWRPGTVGGEYIKAFGHYHRGDFIETYRILSGTGILLLQERKTDADGVVHQDEVTSVRAIFVKPGSVIEIPKAAGHLMVNTGDERLCTIDDSPVEAAPAADTPESSWPKHADYESVRDMRGFAYYVVEKDGVPAFVRNERYRNTPDIAVEYAQ